MEYIFDELKQFIIKEVDEFEEPNQNYLAVYYNNNIIANKNIDLIVLFLDITNFQRKNGFIGLNINGSLWQPTQLNQLICIKIENSFVENEVKLRKI